MPYTLNLSFLDFGGWYANANPPLLGRFFAPPPPSGSTQTPSDVATNPGTGATPFTLLFPAASTPPSPPFTLHIVDSGSGGDLFRSGPLSSLPAAPGPLNIFTTPTATIPTSTINAAAAASIPPTMIPIPGAVSVIAGVLTLGLLIPLRAAITGVAPTPGAAPLTFTVTGTFTTQRFWFLTVTTTFTVTATLTLAPSADSANAARVLSVSVPAAGVGGNTLLPPINSLVAVAVRAAVPGFIEPALNSLVASTVAGTLAGIGQRLSPTATVSARRVVVAPSGIALQIALSDLFGPVVMPLPRTLSVAIQPNPSTQANVSYQIQVRDAVSSTPVPNATVALHNFSATGASLDSTASTDAQGIAVIVATLRGKVTRRITNDGRIREVGLLFSPPTLRVTAMGFTPVTLFLLEEPDFL